MSISSLLINKGVVHASCMDGASVNQGVLNGVNKQLFGDAKAGVICMAHTSSRLAEKQSQGREAILNVTRVNDLLVSCAAQFRQSTRANQRFRDIQAEYNEGVQSMANSLKHSFFSNMREQAKNVRKKKHTQTERKNAEKDAKGSNIENKRV